MRNKSPWRTRVALVGCSFGAGLLIGAISIGSASQQSQTATPAAAQRAAAPGEVLWAREATRVTATPAAQLPRVEGATIQAAIPPAPQMPPRPTAVPPLRLVGVEVVDAGTLRMGTSVYVLADVRAPGLGDLCTDERPGRWRCGSRARDVLAKVLEGRTLDCANRGANEGRVSVTCRVDGTDIAAWMAGEGWVTPDEGIGGPLREAHERARAGRLGQFAADFRSTRRQEAEARLPVSTASAH